MDERHGTVGEGSSTVTDVAAGEVRGRRRPDPVALLVGLLTLGMAVAAFIGDVPDLSGFDPRWLLAAGATVLGIVLLAGSLRRGRRER